LIQPEPDSVRIFEFIENEPELIVSGLARLEALVVVDSLVAGGMPARMAARLRSTLRDLLVLPVFRLVASPVTIFETAERQLSASYCATLDRLHLAIMEELRLSRLMTNDRQQSRAARALGFEVIMQ
jgi:predicted nucleic acid-binding protein